MCYVWNNLQPGWKSMTFLSQNLRGSLLVPMMSSQYQKHFQKPLTLRTSWDTRLICVPSKSRGGESARLVLQVSKRRQWLRRTRSPGATSDGQSMPGGTPWNTQVYTHIFILTFKRVILIWQLSQARPPNKLHTHSGTRRAIIAQLLSWSSQGRGATLPPEDSQVHLPQGRHPPDRLWGGCTWTWPPDDKSSEVSTILVATLTSECHVYWSGTSWMRRLRLPAQ